MPKISELPTHAELTGDEMIAVVQADETRQVALSAALTADRPVSLNNARWLKSGSTFLNDSDVELQLQPNNGGGS